MRFGENNRRAFLSSAVSGLSAWLLGSQLNQTTTSRSVRVNRDAIQRAQQADIKTSTVVKIAANGTEFNSKGEEVTEADVAKVQERSDRRKEIDENVGLLEARQNESDHTLEQCQQEERMQRRFAAMGGLGVAGLNALLPSNNDGAIKESLARFGAGKQTITDLKNLLPYVSDVIDVTKDYRDQFDIGKVIALKLKLPKPYEYNESTIKLARRTRVGGALEEISFGRTVDIGEKRLNLSDAKQLLIQDNRGNLRRHKDEFEMLCAFDIEPYKETLKSYGDIRSGGIFSDGLISQIDIIRILGVRSINNSYGLETSFISLRDVAKALNAALCSNPSEDRIKRFQALGKSIYKKLIDEASERSEDTSQLRGLLEKLPMVTVPTIPESFESNTGVGLYLIQNFINSFAEYLNAGYRPLPFGWTEASDSTEGKPGEGKPVVDDDDTRLVFTPSSDNSIPKPGFDEQKKHEPLKDDESGLVEVSDSGVKLICQEAQLLCDPETLNNRLSGVLSIQGMPNSHLRTAVNNKNTFEDFRTKVLRVLAHNNIISNPDNVTLPEYPTVQTLYEKLKKGDSSFQELLNGEGGSIGLIAMLTKELGKLPQANLTNK